MSYPVGSARERAVVFTFTVPQSLCRYRFTSHPIMPANVLICTHRDEPGSTSVRIGMEMGAANGLAFCEGLAHGAEILHDLP